MLDSENFVHMHISICYFIRTNPTPLSAYRCLSGPGKRWRHSMVIAQQYLDLEDGYRKQKSAIFGGHRLWHGYSPENNQDNNWGLYNTRPLGGYLDDLWIYTKYLDFSVPGASFRSNNGEWRGFEVEVCVSTSIYIL